MCDRGRMVLQDAHVQSHTTIFQLPSNIVNYNHYGYENVKFNTALNNENESFVIARKWVQSGINRAW